MFYRVKWRILLGLFLFASGIQAQRFFTRTYTAADGLSSGSVHGATQDTAGLLWFATRFGISCYDGQVWQNHNRRMGLLGNGYNWIICDEKGTLWALSNSGKLIPERHNGKRWEPYEAPGAPQRNLRYCGFLVFYEKKDPVVVAASPDSGLYICRNKAWTRIKLSKEHFHTSVYGISYHDGQIWCATSQGLILVRNERVDDSFAGKLALPAKTILGVAVDKSYHTLTGQLKVWLLGNDWMGYYTNGRFTMMASGFKLKTGSGIDRAFTCPDGEGGFYFGNPNYVYHYSTFIDRLTLLNKKNGLISEGGTSVLIDREKNAWITGYMGITCLPRPRFTNFTVTEGLADNEVCCALELSPGKFIFGHYGVLSILEGEQFTYLYLDYTNKKEIHETRIIDLMKDRHANLWIAASYLGFAKIDGGRKVTWFNEKNGLKGVAGSVAEAGDGTIYLATNTNLYYLHHGRLVEYNLPERNAYGIRKIIPGSDQNLYFASFTAGIFEVDKNGKVRQYKSSVPDGNNTYTVFIDSRGQRWAGTAAGLFSMNDSILDKTKVDPKIDSPVYLILEDHQDQLWFGTDLGVFRWNGKRMDHFTIMDGLAGMEVNRDAGLVDDQGKIWFGTINGLTCFNPVFDYTLSQGLPPIVEIVRIERDADTLPVNEKIYLKADQNNLTFSFRGISFINEKQVYYSCYLEGFDKGWSEEFLSPNRKYTYNNLAPGSYRFHLKARNVLGIWSEPVATGIIRIKQPFYSQWWFITPGLLVIMLIGYFSFRYLVTARYNTLLALTVEQRTQELKESEHNLIQSNQAKDRFFSIIAHDLRSPFNAILGFLDLLTSKDYEFSPEEQQKILIRLRATALRTADLLENLLAWARTQRGEIQFHPVSFDLSTLIHETAGLMDAAAQAKGVALKAEAIGPWMVMADRNMINTVIRNLVSNAIKFTYPDGVVKVTLKPSGSGTSVCVQDNGCGMSQKMVENLFSLEDHITTQGTGNETGTGLGLILCNEFITLHKGSITVESEQGSGTRICFTLPGEKPAT
jgi:signal transduction histidine kinase/ligand-binding sensor domain-containing protein